MNFYLTIMLPNPFQPTYCKSTPGFGNMKKYPYIKRWKLLLISHLTKVIY